MIQRIVAGALRMPTIVFALGILILVIGLAAYKVPKTVEFVSSLPRSDAMKLSRAALVAERDGPEPEPGAPG